MDIKIHYGNVKFRLKKSLLVKKWLAEVALAESSAPGRIDYFFVDDSSQREINKEFLEHDYNTDVITFNYSEGAWLKGEIYIAPETVRRNAKEFKTTLMEEARRVMVHGLLHLLGYQDESEKEKMEMRMKEDTYLKMIGE